MRLWAISDLHLAYEQNRRAVEELPAHPGDWLILAGDISESDAVLHWALTELNKRFAQLLWTPGNHDLWTIPGEQGALKGVARYERLVGICRQHGVLTPEEPYVRWPYSAQPIVLAPIFTLYDYSFAPNGMAPAEAVAWAEASGVVCSDEYVLWPDPYPTREAWCAARVAETERRLGAIDERAQTVLISHFPLRRDVAQLPRIPRFTIWCGTRKTEEWHTRYRAQVVVSGHLHIPRTTQRDGVRFEEVSFGYPQQRRNRSLAACLRRIL